MRPGPPSSTLILRLQRPTALMPTVAPAGGGWGLRTPPGSPSPVVLHGLCACPATGLECVPLGFGGQGSQGLSTHLGSPWWDPFCEGRYVWCLRNPTWLVGKAQRQEARNQDGRGGLAYHHHRPRSGAGQAWLSCHTHMEGAPCPPQGEGCQSSCLLRTLVWSL